MAANLAAAAILLGLSDDEARGLYSTFNELNRRLGEARDHLLDECVAWEAAIRAGRSRRTSEGYLYVHPASVRFEELRNLGWCDPACTMWFWCHRRDGHVPG
jgi:hypothetical protein